MDRVELLTPHLHNVYPVADQLSPACDLGVVKRSAGTPPYVDALFGHCWSFTPEPGAAVYGRTGELPEAPLDGLASAFLRVPFRRVPVIDVHSVREVLDLASRIQPKDSAFRGVWRGQNGHFRTQRAPDELLRLYGSHEADEPSLLPSAARSKLYFPDGFAAWAGLLDLYVHERAREPAHRRELLNFANAYRYRLWGFATAQHYGLPSVGLDVTPDIQVALFFALHRFDTDRATGATVVSRALASDSPIIYGLNGFSDHELLEDEKLAPARLACARPAAQSAMFFSTGWGHAPNHAAQRVHVALRLVGHAGWPLPVDPRKLFPGPDEDEFLRFLLNCKSTIAVPAVQDLLSRIYYVP